MSTFYVVRFILLVIPIYGARVRRIISAIVFSSISGFLPLGFAACQETAPVHSIELEDWYLTLPVDEDEDGKADRISESRLASGWSDKKFFYVADDGGLTFISPVSGAKTSKNTKYTRTELREMLRRGNTKISTTGLSKNNWVSSTSSKKHRKKAGGVNGELHASLAVNHVTTTGDKTEIGRVIIGQIHGKDDEPVRLYYRKLPNHNRGSLYFAHEIKGQDQDVYIDLIGSRSSDAEDPKEGIALNEKFSYSIVLAGDLLEV